jgi:ATP-dependent protease HslVU (ClpYQ) peptidase subunit
MMVMKEAFLLVIYGLGEKTETEVFVSIGAAQDYAEDIVIESEPHLSYVVLGPITVQIEKA